ncbi:MAG: LCP family protein [Clostridia bacterium]|nr:LCP family protein [Clostridia bacterium]
MIQMKINLYRNPYYDDDSDEELREEAEYEIIPEYDTEPEEDIQYEYVDSPDDSYTYDEPEEQEEAPVKKRKRKKKKLRLIWRILIKLAAFIVALCIVMLAVGYVFSLFIPPATNVLVMATDEDGTRTDTLMLVTFLKKTKEISILSIPRDTYVTVSDENFALMREEFPEPGSPSMKINAVHHFGGEKYGVDMIKQEVGNLLGVNVDFHIKIDFEAFKFIIDSIGGIEFDVPRNMSYTDPLQNLYINLQKGPQRLNGEQAEHLLRYRSGYADADLGRIRVQQDFVKAFVSQTVSKGTILSHLGVYLDVMFKYNYVETNARFFDVVSYALSIGGLKTDSIKTQTLPGTAAMRGGQSVYLPDLSEIDNFIPDNALRNKKTTVITR